MAQPVYHAMRNVLAVVVRTILTVCSVVGFHDWVGVFQHARLPSFPTSSMSAFVEVVFTGLASIVNHAIHCAEVAAY